MRHSRLDLTRLRAKGRLALQAKQRRKSFRWLNPARQTRENRDFPQVFHRCGKQRGKLCSMEIYQARDVIRFTTPDDCCMPAITESSTRK